MIFYQRGLAKSLFLWSNLAVAVRSDRLLKPFTHALALGFTLGFSPRAVVNGFFVCHFLSNRMTRVTSQGLHGLTSQNTPHSSTPVSKKRPALIDRLVKHKVTQVETRLCV